MEGIRYVFYFGCVSHLFRGEQTEKSESSEEVNEGNEVCLCSGLISHSFKGGQAEKEGEERQAGEEEGDEGEGSKNDVCLISWTCCCHLFTM